MSNEREITEIIVHCSGTPPSRQVDVETIKKWHTDSPPKGNGWSDIGYHFVILRNGVLRTGRPVNRKGAHVRGHNDNSIGICLVGGKSEGGVHEFNFTPDQARTLRSLINGIQAGRAKPLKVLGHRDYDPSKDCPCFDVGKWWTTGRWEG